MCEICNGYFGCPVCSEEPEQEECPNCDNGRIYVSAEHGEVSFEVWETLPEDERCVDECEVCDGTGYVD
jgi:hypothetical protein